MAVPWCTFNELLLFILFIELNLNTYHSNWYSPFQELIATEQRYLQDLQDIITGYLNVLEDTVNSDPSIDLNLNLLFCNIRNLHNLHLEFLNDMKQADVLQDVANCFTQRKDKFISEYTIYCNNYPNTCEILKDINFNQNLKILSNFRICQQSLGHLLPLAAYLLKPVQRILKYPLLIKAMLNEAFTVNYNHFAVNGYQEMKTAFDCMSEVAEEINLMKRKHELTLRVNELQSMLVGWGDQDLNSYGELVLEDQFKVKGYRKERHIFLFEKLFLVAKKEDEDYIHPMHILVNNLMLLETPKEGNNYLRVYEHKNPQNYFLIEFNNTNTRKDWANAIKDLIILSGPAMTENYRKRILEACQTTNDVLCNNEHSSYNKFRDLANIKKRFRKAKPKRNTPQLTTDIDENTPRMRHSHTFSPNSNSPRHLHRHKRMSDVTPYDSTYLENEIRMSDDSHEVSKISIEEKEDVNCLLYPNLIDESMQLISPTSGGNNNSPLNSTSISDTSQFDLLSNSISNDSISNEQNASFNKSPSRKGAIRRKTNTYLNKKLSETFSASTEDEFGIRKNEAKLRRRHTDKEINPVLLDPLITMNNFTNVLKSEENTIDVDKPLKSEESDSDSSKIGSKSPEYFKQRVNLPMNDNSERKRSRIMDSDEIPSQYETPKLDFSSPDFSFASIPNQQLSSPQYKNTPSISKSRVTRRTLSSRSNSNAKKRLNFEETNFNPDPSTLNTAPQIQLKHCFGQELGELNFKSKQSFDDYYLAAHRVFIDTANKFNTVRPKKSSMKSFFEDTDDSSNFRRHLSLPQPRDVSHLTNLFKSPASNDFEDSLQSRDDCASSPFDSSVELNASTVETKHSIEISIDTIDSSQIASTEIIIEPKSPIENTNENILLEVSTPEVSSHFEPKEINELLKPRVLLDGPPSDNSDSDSIKSINENLPEKDETPEELIDQRSPHEELIHETSTSIELINQPSTHVDKENSIPDTLNSEFISQTDVSHSNENELIPILRHSNQVSPTIEKPPTLKRSNSQYTTQVLQFVFVSSISILIAIKFLFLVFYKK